MRTAVSSSHWRWTALIVLSFGVLGGLAWRAALAAEEPATRDLSDFVEVKPSHSLLGTGGGYFAKVTVKNVGEDDLAGPIAVVVKGTGLATLRISEPTGNLPSGEPYFVIVPQGQTLVVEKSKTMTLDLQSEGALRGADRRKFALDVQVVQLLADKEKKEEPAAGRPGLPGLPGIPNGGAAGAPPGNAGNGGNQQPAKEPKLEPKPADGPLPKQPEADGKPDPGLGTKPPADEAVKRVMGVQNAVTPEFLKQAGVVGTGTGLASNGDVVLRVYVERAGIRKNLPESVQGVQVQTVVTGKMRPFYDTPASGKQAQAGVPRQTSPDPNCDDNPRQFFARAVPIGVSIMSERTGCAAGTLGCRVKDSNGNLFILSNNHVMADENSGVVGDLILQPGPLDAFTQCVDDPSTSIAELADFVPIDTTGGQNIIDAAISSTTAAEVGNATVCGGYGKPKTTTAPATLGLAVMKYGRTTNLRVAYVTALNVSVVVGYVPGPALFVQQIEFRNDLTDIPLGAPGDSGSLIVTKSSRNPVALLFAGSALVTIGNPIDDVLTAFDVTIDGETPGN